MLDCLTNIIGVTPNENECVTGGLTPEQIAALKVSTSGVFLDDLAGGIHLKAVRNADATKGLYPMVMGALATAAKSLENDLVLALSRKYSKSRKNFVGQIGRMSFAQTMAAPKDWQFIRLRPVDYSDAVVTLSRITVVLSQAATFNIYLIKVPYKASMGTIIETFPVTVQANAYQSIIVGGSAGMALPLAENGEAVEYYITYSRSEAGGALPKDNKLACATCEITNGGPAVGDFLEVKGGQLDDLGNLQAAQVDDYGHGLILDVSIKCDSAKLFCGQYNQDEAVAITMAYAVQFKAGELLIEEVLKSPDLNRYTTMDKERLWGKRNHFRAEYDGRIVYLAEAIDITASNCYVCREQINQPFAAGIFS